MEDTLNKIKKLDLDGNHLCLDFINTVEYRTSKTKEKKDYLLSFTHLIQWGKHVGMISNYEYQDLITFQNAYSKQTRSTFLYAIKLRETIFNLLINHINNIDPDKKNLESFNKIFSNLSGLTKIEHRENKFLLGYQTTSKSANWILLPIINATTQLLTSFQLENVRLCNDIDCGWFFLDTSKNKKRQWCSMKSCGNKAKAASFRKRNKLC